VDWMAENLLAAARERGVFGALTLAELTARLAWLTHLRWIAAAGVVVLPLAVDSALKYHLPVLSLALVGVAIAAYNLAFRAWLKAHSATMDFRLTRLMANTQIAVDLAALTVVLHLSGGVGNPLSCYYVFHVVIAATMLTPLAAYGQATWAVLLYSAMVGAEAAGWLPHHSLGPLEAESLYRSPHAALPVLAMASAVYVTAYLTCSIALRLRERETELEQMSLEAHNTAAQCRLAYDELLVVQHAQVQYMRRVTHELKAPLSAIAQALSVVLEGLTGDVPEKQREMLERSYRRAQDAIATLGDLLDLARMRELPQAEFSAVDVSHVAETVVDEYAEQAASRRIQIGFQARGRLPAVHGDHEALTTMLANLLSNAVKYCGDGGHVTMTAEAEGDYVVLRVTDNGPGISQDDLPRVFDEFYRAPEMRQSGLEGTGLGLAIVRSIVERHGGMVTAHSESEVGTTFVVRLPAEREPTAEDAPPAEQ